MGVALTDLLNPKPITLDDLQDKIVAIDAFNMIYQFLSSLRGPDGSLMTDSKGNVTSHLIGLLSRTTRLMQKGIKCVYIFDGEAPLLKQKERERRRAIKEAAVNQYEEAKKTGDTEQMRKFATRTASLTPEMAEEAKKLIRALGIPVVEAPSEGEAQAAVMQARGDVDYVASQDTDSLLFGAEKVIRNLSILGKRKKVSKLTYETVTPELLTLSDVLNTTGLDKEKLILLGMLVGTDFNVGGIKGLGPKKGMKVVKEYSDYNQMFLDVKWHENFDFDWHEVYDLFITMPTVETSNLEWNPIDEEALHKLLCDEHDFSAERVTKSIEKIMKQQAKMAQKGLGDFF